MTLYVPMANGKQLYSYRRAVVIIIVVRSCSHHGFRSLLSAGKAQKGRWSWIPLNVVKSVHALASDKEETSIRHHWFVNISCIFTNACNIRKVCVGVTVTVFFIGVGKTTIKAIF